MLTRKTHTKCLIKQTYTNTQKMKSKSNEHKHANARTAHICMQQT